MINKNNDEIILMDLDSYFFKNIKSYIFGMTENSNDSNKIF